MTSMNKSDENNIKTFGDLFKRDGIKYDPSLRRFVVMKCSEEGCTHPLRTPKAYSDLLDLFDDFPKNKCLSHEVIKNLKT